MTQQLDCTVIIPTHNRAELLRHTLHALTRQTLPPERFQVLVMDDGSVDDTPAVVEEFSQQLNLGHHRLPHEGFWVGRVRNAGIRHAVGEVCVFLDAGVMAHSECLAAHVAAHRSISEPLAVCGYVYCYNVNNEDTELIRQTVDVRNPDRTISELRRTGRWPDVREDFYARYSDDFHDLPAPWLVYWTVNSSARTEQLHAVGMFDEAFHSWGGEDLDLGYRLHEAGAKITLSREAASIHLPHRKDFDSNMRSVAVNYRYMAEKYQRPVFDLLVSEPPERFFAINDMLRGSDSVEAA